MDKKVNKSWEKIAKMATYFWFLSSLSSFCVRFISKEQTPEDISNQIEDGALPTKIR